MYKKKCAEVFYQNMGNFSIVCTQCEMEAVQFEEFLAHFKEVHSCEQQGLENESVFIKSEKDLEENSLQQDCDLRNTLYENPIELNCNGQTLMELEENFKSENDSEDHHDRLELVSESEDNNISLKLLQRSLINKSKPTELEHSCTECGKVYKSRKALTRHIKCKHIKSTMLPEQFQCIICKKTYSNLSALQAHKRMKHREKKDDSLPGNYPCTKCDKVYLDKYSLKYHLLRHSGQRNFNCDFPGCSKSFYCRKNLNFHVRNMHVGVKNYICEICGHSTKTGASLTMHKRTHTGEKPYNCSICKKAFATQSGVREHKAIHNAIDDRPYVCNICGKTFARPKALYHHKPLHLDIKKFVCKICGKAYSQQAGLSAHKRQHLHNKE